MNQLQRCTAFAITSLLLLAPAVSADNHEEMQPFGAIFSFSTENPAAVMDAVRTFAESDCRKAMPTTMRLMSNLFNGEDEATHTMLWNNASIEDMQSSFGAFGACRESAVFSAALRELTKPVAQMMTMPLVYGGEAANDTVYTIWSLTVTDEAAYVAAYEELMEAQVDAGLAQGAWGLIRVVGGASMAGGTHFAYTGSPSMASHFSGGGGSAAYAAFAAKVADIRTINGIDVGFVAGDY